MRPTRVLLMVCAAAGTLSVLAALFSAERAAAQGTLVASAALIGYVLLAGPAPPRVRPALAAGIALLSIPTVMELWRVSSAPDRRSLVPIYTPRNGDAPGRTAFSPQVLDQWRQVLDQERLASLGLLLGVLCLAVAVLALPARARPKATVLAGGVAVLLLLIVGAEIWSRSAGEPLLGLVGAAWPALLATLVAAGVLALSAPRADRTALVPLGALLVAVSAAVALDDLTAGWAAWWTSSHPDDGVFLSAGVAVARTGVADLSAALLAAATIAGPALLAVGALRASRTADPT